VQVLPFKHCTIDQLQDLLKNLTFAIIALFTEKQIQIVKST